MLKRLLYVLVLIAVSGLTAFAYLIGYTDFLFRTPVKLESINYDQAFDDPSKWVVTLWNAYNSSARCGVEGHLHVRRNSLLVLHYRGFVNGKRVYERHKIEINGNK